MNYNANLADFMRHFSGLLTAAIVLAAAPASAAVVTFTDQASFEAAFGSPVIIEEFDGPASEFAADSTGNAVGSGIKVDVNGPANGSLDIPPIGLTGNGPVSYTHLTLPTTPYV